MKDEFIAKRGDRDFVLYAGLLDQAHSEGLKSIKTELLQAPSKENGQVAICYAEVTTDKGTYTGLGDASPENVSRMMVPHLLRMAETRAKARALRDAINVGAAALEEFDPDDDDAPAGKTYGSGQPPAERSKPADAKGKPAAKAAPKPQPGEPGGPEHASPPLAGRPASSDLSSPAQVRAIYEIASGLGMKEVEVDQDLVAFYGVPEAGGAAGLTKQQASDYITLLKDKEPRPAAKPKDDLADVPEHLRDLPAHAISLYRTWSKQIAEATKDSLKTVWHKFNEADKQRLIPSVITAQITREKDQKKQELGLT